MSTDQLPVERVRFNSRNYDEAAEFIRQAYFDDRLRISGGEAGKYATYRASAGTAIGAELIQTTFGFTFHSAPIDFVGVGHVHRGTLRQTTSDEDLHLTGGDVFMVRPSIPMTNTISRFVMQGLQIPVAAVNDIANAHSHLDSADLRFHSGRPVSTAMARYLRATVAMALDDLSSEDSALANPLVAEQMQRQLAATVLAAFPNTTMTSHHRAPSKFVAPTAVRRAVAYIEAHADQPIRLADIADAAGAGPRALQYAFNRHYGTTPVGYLTRVRLERAHRDLQAADPHRGVTVAAIARRWGFASPSRFGTVYRAAYGQTPGRTLRT